MNPKYFGDSYDIVKRFFCAELKTLGYAVSVQAMLTGDWQGTEADFYRFIGGNEQNSTLARHALFFDPDTGVHARPSSQHISLRQLCDAATHHDLAFSFDQSFSRQHSPGDVMRQKLLSLSEMNCHGMYYDSHARFLFASSNCGVIDELERHLTSIGLPAWRLIRSSG